MASTTKFTTLTIIYSWYIHNPKTWFKRPGTASIFIPKLGIAHECKTSPDVIKNRIGTPVGILNVYQLLIIFLYQILIPKLELYTIKFIRYKLKSRFFIFNSIIKFIRSISWWPITLTVNLGSNSSSKEYNKYNEGTKIQLIIQ